MEVRCFLFCAILPLVSPFIYTKQMDNASCLEGGGCPCFSSPDGDNFSRSLSGSVNIVFVASPDAGSKEACSEAISEIILILEYVMADVRELYDSSSYSWIDYAIICTSSGKNITDSAVLRPDGILHLLQNSENAAIIVAAYSDTVFTSSLIWLAGSMNVPVFSLDPLTPDQTPTFRIVPSTAELISAVVEVIDHFEWSWISLLSSDDDISRDVLSNMELELERKQTICIDVKMFVDSSLDAGNESVERRRIFDKVTMTTARVIVVFVFDAKAHKILTEIMEMFPDRIWISASLGNIESLPSPPTTIAISPTVYNFPPSFDAFLIDWCVRWANCSELDRQLWGTVEVDYEFICEAAQTNATTMTTTARHAQLLGLYVAVHAATRDTVCEQAAVNDSGYEPGCTFAFKVNELLAHDLLSHTNDSQDINQFDFDLLSWGFDVRATRWTTSPQDGMIKWSRADRTENEVGNGEDGDGDVEIVDDVGLYGLYRSNQLVIDPSREIWPGEVPASRCTAECPSNHLQFPLPGWRQCCFLCVHCEGNLTYDANGLLSCDACPERTWFDITSGACEPRHLDFLRWDSIPGLVCVAISLFSFVVNAVLLVVIGCHHTSPIVKAANRDLSLLLLVATLIATGTPLLHLGFPTPTQCMVHVGLQGPLISLIVSIHLVKTKSVLSLFEARLPDLMHRHLFLQRHLQLLGVLCLVLIEVAAVIAYLIFTPPGVVYIDSRVPHITYVECDYGVVALPVQWLYNWCIVAVAFVLAFRARHLPENFGESRLIAGSMGFGLISWVVSFICFALTHGSLKAIFQNAVLVVCPWIFMGFLYFPKCYIILRQPHRNTARELRRMTLAHIQKRAEAVCESSASHRTSVPDIQEETTHTMVTSLAGARPNGHTNSPATHARSRPGVSNGTVVLQMAQLSSSSLSGLDADGVAVTDVSWMTSTSPSSKRSSRSDTEVDSQPELSAISVLIRSSMMMSVGCSCNSPCSNCHHLSTQVSLCDTDNHPDVPQVTDGDMGDTAGRTDADSCQKIADTINDELRGNTSAREASVKDKLPIASSHVEPRANQADGIDHEMEEALSSDIVMENCFNICDEILSPDPVVVQKEEKISSEDDCSLSESHISG